MALSVACAFALMVGTRLGDTVTIHRSYLTVSEVCRELTKIDGSKYALTPSQSARKVAVFCDVRPVSELREAIAALLESEWKDNEGTLRLVPLAVSNDKAKRAENSARLREILRVLAWKHTLSLGGQSRVASGKDPYTGPKPKLLSEDELSQVLKMDGLGPYAWSCAQDLENSCKKLEAGDELDFSPETGESRMPTLPTTSDYKPGRGAIRLSRGQSSLELTYFMSVGNDVIVSLDQEAAFRVAKIEDGVVRGWSSKPSFSDKPLRALDQWSPVKYSCVGLGLAENAETLSVRSGLPVVCDSFRIAVSPAKPVAAETIGEYVAQVVRTSNSYRSFAPVLGAKMVGDWVVLKQASGATYAEQEVPEPVFRLLEKKAESKKQLSLDDYADFASRLTPIQESCWRQRREPAILARFSVYALRDHVPQLKFWNTLTSEQRRHAYEGGLLQSSLLPSQTDAFRRAATATLRTGPVPEADFVRFYMRGEPMPEIAFKVKSEVYPGPDYNLDALPELGTVRAQGTVPVSERPKTTREYVLLAFGQLPDPKMHVSVFLPRSP